MKAARIVLLYSLIAMFTMGFSIVEHRSEKSPDQELRDEVTRLIGKPDLQSIPLNDRKASIKFILTSEDELLVTHVDTRSERIENYVKSRLNYKEFKAQGVQRMHTYAIDVSFVED